MKMVKYLAVKKGESLLTVTLSRLVLVHCRTLSYIIKITKNKII